MQQLLPCFQGMSVGCIWHQLKVLQISWQRGRDYTHSPDVDYSAKVAHMMQLIETCDRQRQAVLFADQMTYTNHASVSKDWAVQRCQPLAKRAIGSTLKRRVAALLDFDSARLTYLHRAKTTVPNLIMLYEKAVERYADKDTLYIVVDNWPVHFHPDLIACLEPQRNPFKYKLPASWQKLKPKKKYLDRQPKLPIQLISLPTYASWLNPIEKVWKRLKSEVIHLHPHHQHFESLQQHVIQRLDQWHDGSHDMLSYCGLICQTGIFAQARIGFYDTPP